MKTQKQPSTCPSQQTTHPLFKLGNASILVESDEFERGYVDGYVDYPKESQPSTVGAIRKMLIETLASTAESAHWQIGYIAGAMGGISEGYPSELDRDPEFPFITFGPVTLYLNCYGLCQGYYDVKGTSKANQADRQSARPVMTAKELLRSITCYDLKTDLYTLTDDQLRELKDSFFGELLTYACPALFPPLTQEQSAECAQAELLQAQVSL